MAVDLRFTYLAKNVFVRSQEQKFYVDVRHTSKCYPTIPLPGSFPFCVHYLWVSSSFWTWPGYTVSSELINNIISNKHDYQKHITILIVHIKFKSLINLFMKTYCSIFSFSFHLICLYFLKILTSVLPACDIFHVLDVFMKITSETVTENK